jgi:hypothetical protein
MLATQLRDALERRVQGQDPSTQVVTGIAIPDRPGHEADVEALLPLADAMGRAARQERR